MGEAGPGAQQVGGQGVAGLMRHTVADVEVSNPTSEPTVEPLVVERDGAVGVAVGGREQRQPGAFGVAGAAAVLGGEPVQGLALPLGDEVMQPLRDTDRGVVVADLGLVVPEHRQPAVAAQAVPADLQHLSDAPAGGDGDFPHIAQSAILRVVDLGEPAQVGLISQRAGHLVGERAARGSAGGRRRRWARRR